MTYVSGVLGFLVVVLWVYCLVDTATTPAGRSRYLNKWFWLAIVALFSIAGSVAWLMLGRPRRVPADVVGSGPAGSSGPAPDEPRKPVLRRRPAVLAPDDDPDFLRRLEEIAELERRARGDEPPAAQGPTS